MTLGCPLKVKLCFEGTYNLHLEGQKISKSRAQQEAGGKQSSLRSQWYGGHTFTPNADDLPSTN
jgi:hypothetical protein